MDGVEKLPEGIGVLAEAAVGLHEMYASLREAGFSEREALQLVAMIVTSARPPTEE